MKIVIALLLGLIAASPAFAGTPPDGADSCVIVEVYLRQRDDLKRSPAEINRLSGDDFKHEKARETRSPLLYPGVVVGEGEVLIPEPNLEVPDWGECFALTRTGRRIPITPAGRLMYAPGVLLTGEPADLPAPAKFVESATTAWGETLTGVWIWRQLDEIVVHLREGLLSGWTEDGVFGRNPFPYGALILNADGQPVGVSLDRYLYRTADGRTTFDGVGLLKMPGIPQDVFRKRLEAARDRTSASIVRVKLEYRLPGKDEGYSYRADHSDSTGYGLAIGEGRVFLPIDPGYQKLRRLSRVVAIRGDGSDTQEIEGRFLGSYRTFAGVLLEFDEIEGLIPAETSMAGAVDRFELLLRVEPKRQFGKDSVRLRHSRYNGEMVEQERGSERRAPIILPVTYPGRILLDLEGRVRGVVTLEKFPEAESGGVDATVRRRFHQPRARIYWCSDLAESWKKPETHFDERAKPRSRLEAKRGVWLGVEFQYVKNSLAREMSIQDATRDGERGLLVSFVYAGSPAARLGIKSGDVLLQVLEAGKPETERKELLRPQYGGSASYGSRGFPSRSNELTNLLTGLGEGKKVVLTWLRDREEMSAELTLEQSPPDYTSAEKWKCEPLGLTVRDLTYEVRAYYRLPPDFTGVIVSNTDSGSPAVVGGIYGSDILELVNGEPFSDVAAFREVVTKLLEAKTPSLTFFAKRLTGTRFIEIRPDAKAESGEEKPDAEEE